MGGLLGQSKRGLRHGSGKKGGLRHRSGSGKKGGLRHGSGQKRRSLLRHIPVLDTYVSVPPPGGQTWELMIYCG